MTDPARGPTTEARPPWRDTSGAPRDPNAAQLRDYSDAVAATIVAKYGDRATREAMIALAWLGGWTDGCEAVRNALPRLAQPLALAGLNAEESVRL